MLLVDPQTEKGLIMILRKLYSDGPQFHLFTFAPNQPNQKSTEAHEGMPLFRFAKLAGSGGDLSYSS